MNSTTTRLADRTFDHPVGLAATPRRRCDFPADHPEILPRAVGCHRAVDH